MGLQKGSRALGKAQSLPHKAALDAPLGACSVALAWWAREVVGNDSHGNQERLGITD